MKTAPPSFCHLFKYCQSLVIRKRRMTTASCLRFQRPSRVYAGNRSGRRRRRTSDSHLLHARNEGCRLDAEQLGGAARPMHLPPAALQGGPSVFALELRSLPPRAGDFPRRPRLTPQRPVPGRPAGVSSPRFPAEPASWTGRRRLHQGQVVTKQAVLGKDEGPLRGVLKLPDVARPIVALSNSAWLR
jgi:hypothetical protein